jgi:hypothetical protein
MRPNDDMKQHPGAGEILEQAAARMGFTTEDMEILLQSELNVDQLLEYLQAVILNRMH